MDWVASFLMCLLIVGVFFLGFFAGNVCGKSRGWCNASSYYNSYRDEHNEIINRLRGRIIWLEQSIKEARERLERVENEP